jgi:hypothetical protein
MGREMFLTVRNEGEMAYLAHPGVAAGTYRLLVIAPGYPTQEPTIEPRVFLPLVGGS